MIVVMNAISLEELGWSNCRRVYKSLRVQQLRGVSGDPKQHKAVIYPSGKQKIFNALDSTPLIRSGGYSRQDPKITAPVRHGLCFSVMPGGTSPPSLANIYRRIQADLGLRFRITVTYMAEQAFQVIEFSIDRERGQAGSHQNKGWETFDRCVRIN
jgi:uracil-DNA glycosylase